jgi:TPR repeat protein
MENSEQQYDVFISYSRDDYWDSEQNEIPGNAVSVIKEALKNAGINYWIDEEGIAPGDNFPVHIAEIIGLSHILVFISSYNSICKSQWTTTEVALACEHGKLIIPVRIDDTPYIKNNELATRIAARSYIDYYKNPEKGVNDLIGRIKSYIQELKEQEEWERLLEIERLKEEEERKRKEKEEQDRLLRELKDAQKKLISDIIKDCESINLEETAINNKREQLLLRTKDITDLNERAEVKSHIRAASPIRQINLKEMESLQGQVKELEGKIEMLNKEKEDLIKQNQENEKSISKLNKRLEKTKKKAKNSGSGYKSFRWLLFVLLGAIAAALCWFFLIEPNLNDAEKQGPFLTADGDDIADTVSGHAEGWVDTLNFILQGLSTVAPQLQGYVDGYKNNDPEAIHKLAKCFESGAFLEGNRNLNIAGHLAHVAAGLGYAPAQTTLGFYFYNGRGGYTCNFDSSTYWYNEAIKNGSVDAKFYLGQAYATGRYEGTVEGKPNTSMAKKLYIESAEEGQANSQLNLGIYYYTDQNYEAAKKWIMKSLDGDLSENEKARAYFMMGQLYGTGKNGVTYDPKKAFDYYSKAATTGDGYAQAMYYLGVCYQNGKGTTRDMAKAKEWYQKAASRGSKKANDKLNSL